MRRPRESTWARSTSSRNLTIPSSCSRGSIRRCGPRRCWIYWNGAHLDGLTELGNRFALQDTLPIEFAAAQQSGAPLSVVIADIDHFKKINDQYGHAAGDEVLRRMADLLRRAVRPNDFIARFGGEEFVALCPGCPLESSIAIAERIREAAAEMRVGFRNHSIHMTTSLGVFCTEESEAIDPQTALDRADQALYRAKSSGRNAVWYYNAETRQPAPAAQFARVPIESVPTTSSEPVVTG